MVAARSNPPAREETFWNSRAVRNFRRNRLAVAGLVMAVAYVLVALFAPLFAPPPKVGNNCLRDLGATSPSAVYNPLGATFWKATFLTPGSCYQIARYSFKAEPTPPGLPIATDVGSVRPLFGTAFGYDIYYGLVWGTRLAFQISLSVALISVVLGLIIGSVAGYFGGWVDNLIMRFIDVILAFPAFILTMVITTLLGPSLVNIMIAFVVTGWIGYARYLRAEILRLRQLEFVDGAKAIGASDARVMFRHILPNALTSITVLLTLELGSVPLSVAALSFLGIGLPIGTADWGQIIQAARSWLQGPPGNPLAYWYVTFFPATVIVLYGLAWALLGDALRDALDPRER